MNKGTFSKPYPLPEMTEALKAHFVPQVEARCIDIGIDLMYGLKYVAITSNNTMLYYLTITPVSISQDPTMDEIASLIEALKPFNRNDDGPFTYGGRNWHLGDGDDTLATFMSEGRFCIWLRGWVPSQD